MLVCTHGWVWVLVPLREQEWEEDWRTGDFVQSSQASSVPGSKQREREKSLGLTDDGHVFWRRATGEWHGEQQERFGQILLPQLPSTAASRETGAGDLAGQ